MRGVLRIRVGYAGGVEPNPTYLNIKDHSESVEIVYDPTRVGYENLLDVFWKGHDPTKDFSTQYASNIFYHDEEQRRAAEASKLAVESLLGGPVFTSIRPAGVFTRAEDYHQKYFLQLRPVIAAEFARMYADVQAGFDASAAAARINGFLGGFGGKAQLEEELNWYGLGPAAVSSLLRETRDLPPDCSCVQE
ncbi:MAG TPA: methionine sulfoxide reductase [Planctomycetes bacterium]|nr:methionine sulfoxide reductase [Planctomycetota bacterium]